MTVPAKTSDFETGLEDFGMEDAVIPRITISHKTAEYKDSLSGEVFDKLYVVILGLVKQRVLWHPDVEDDDWPMCRSVNHDIGLPNMSDEQPKDKRFPWDRAKFDKDDFPPDEEGVVRLPCSGCFLKEWKSHPDGKKPYCSEQYTLPILYSPHEDDDVTEYVPAIITFQKTGLKPLKTYLSSFARSRSAAFQAVTLFELNPEKRGSTDYATPRFKKVGDTDDGLWREFSMNYRSMREFLTAEPGTRNESDPDSAPAATTPAPEAKEEPKQDDGSKDTVDAEVVEDKPEQQDKIQKDPEPESKSESPADDDDDLPF